MIERCVIESGTVVLVAEANVGVVDVQSVVRAIVANASDHVVMRNATLLGLARKEGESL